MKIYLYIDGILADLDSSSLVQLNYTREEMSDPAIVKNSYAQTISLPLTANNRKIFAQFERKDSTGLNPLKRIPFVIMNDRAERLVNGYCKLESVSDTYSVALFGGLGDFFYSLSYKDDGTPLTLADLDFFGHSADYYDFSAYGGFNAAAVWDAWAHFDHSRTMDHPENAGLFSVLNFAPCNNGVPENFSADKVLAKRGDFEGMATTAVAREGVVYNYRNDYSLIEVGADLTEWMSKDLRCNLQRPIFSLHQMCNAIYNMGEIGDGYTFDVHESITENFDIYNVGWITLPLIDKDADLDNLTLADFLRKTKSPAEYLINFAKMYGFVFLLEGKSIKLVSRDYFYNGNYDGGTKVNIDMKIDRSREIITRPVDLISKYYRWGLATEGAAAEQYEQTYRQPYGAQLLNTGYDFTRETKEVLESVDMKIAPNVREKSGAFVTGIEYQSTGVYKVFWPWKGGQQTLYNEGVDGTKSETFAIPSNAVHSYHDAQETNLVGLYDTMSRPQFHDDSGKPTDGADVLLVFRQMKALPKWIDDDTHLDYGTALWYHLTDPAQSLFDTFNNGQPCWLTAHHTNAALNKITSLPWFECIGFAEPRETYAPNYGSGFSPIYPSFWGGYIADRYDKDCKVVTAWVDLRGMQVNEGLLRNFYYFDNCYWVMNKIINHSLTTDGCTQCEFVKVKDIDNYINSQAEE